MRIPAKAFDEVEEGKTKKSVAEKYKLNYRLFCREYQKQKQNDKQTTNFEQQEIDHLSVALAMAMMMENGNDILEGKVTPTINTQSGDSESYSLIVNSAPTINDYVLFDSLNYVSKRLEVVQFISKISAVDLSFLDMTFEMLQRNCEVVRGVVKTMDMEIALENFFGALVEVLMTFNSYSGDQIFNQKALFDHIDQLLGRLCKLGRGWVKDCLLWVLCDKIAKYLTTLIRLQKLPPTEEFINTSLNIYTLFKNLEVAVNNVEQFDESKSWVCALTTLLRQSPYIEPHFPYISNYIVKICGIL